MHLPSIRGLRSMAVVRQTEPPQVGHGMTECSVSVGLSVHKDKVAVAVKRVFGGGAATDREAGAIWRASSVPLQGWALRLRPAPDAAGASAFLRGGTARAYWGVFV